MFYWKWGCDTNSEVFQAATTIDIADDFWSSFTCLSDSNFFLTLFLITHLRLWSQKKKVMTIIAVPSIEKLNNKSDQSHCNRQQQKLWSVSKTIFIFQLKTSSNVSCQTFFFFCFCSKKHKMLMDLPANSISLKTSKQFYLKLQLKSS